MHKVFTVAKWEFTEKVRSRSFVISLFLTPMIIILFSIVPALLADDEAESTKIIGVIDAEGSYFSGMREFLGQYQLKEYQPAYILVNLYNRKLTPSENKLIGDSAVLKGNVEGYILFNTSGDSLSAEYRSLNAGNLKDAKRLEKALSYVRISKNFKAAGIDKKVINTFLTDTEIKLIRLDKTGEESESGFIAVFFSSLIFIMILAFVILSSGGMLVRSLVEEKSNRLIEILVSSCTSGELLTGKILGLSMLALFQMIIWAGFGVVLAGNQLVPDSAFDHFLPMLVYFMLGFFLYTALFVGIGSIVTTEQEAQQLSGYLSLILFLPMIFSVSTIENPDSPVVSVLTYIPLTTPTIMILKFNIKPVSTYEIISTILLMVFSISLVIFVSSKIFRIGILSYGKMPAIKELIHWLREN